MSTGSFGGTGTSVIAFTDQWVHVGGAVIPAGRNTMFNGGSPSLITSMGAYVSGRGATRTIQLSFEGVGQTGSFAVGAAGSASDTGAQACSILSNGGTFTFRITGNGSFYFGRGGTGGPSSDSYGSTLSATLYGYYTYVSSPTAPLTPAVSGPTTTSAAVSWTAPSDNGDSPITGYRVDYSTSATFASNVSSVEVGAVLSYTVTGLTPSVLYYFRIFAENTATSVAATWSQPTATVSLTTGAGGAGGAVTVALQATPNCSFVYPTSSAGVWSFWMTQSAASWFIAVSTTGTYGGATLQLGVDPTVGFWASTSTRANPIGDGPTYLPAAGFPGSHRFSVSVGWSGSSYPLTLYVDGVQVATGSSVNVTPPANWVNANRQPTLVQIGTTGTVGTAVISRLQHTLTQAHEEFATLSTEAGYLAAVAAATPQIVLPIPSTLSAAPVGFFVASNQSTLDALNLIMHTEQGYIDTTTAGLIANPAQSIRVRPRDRPSAVSYTFDGVLEVSGVINFVRDSTNLIWSDAVAGANGSTQTVSQPALQTRAGSNNASDTVATYRSSDLYEYGSDRLWRGQNVALRPVSVTINNMTCPTDRSSDLLNMAPGDRIEIVNIPNGVLGFTTWDGWLLDKDQTHTSGSGAGDVFTLYLQPCQPFTGIFDTDQFANGGNLTLTTALTAGAVSMVCASADMLSYFEQVATPYTLLIDSERVIVTAAAAPSAGSQTVTITRAANGTTAAAHQIGAAPEVITNSIFAY